MLKNKIVKSTLSLIFVGMISKFLSTVGRVLTAREIGQEGMGLLMTTSPIMILFINIIQLSFPTSIAKIIAQNKDKTKIVIITTSILALIINSLFMIFIITFSPFIATNILKNPNTELPINALALLIPLISLSGILKGYYTGIGKIEITAYSQISEEFARIAFIVLFGGFFFTKGPQFGAYGALISMAVGEVFSISHMIIYLQGFKRKSKSFFVSLISKSNLMIKEVMSISLPLTSARLIGSLTYLLEPIIINSVLLARGVSLSEITIEYGILSGFALPLLLMPGFFASSIGRALLHPMTSSIAKKDYKKAKSIFYTMSGISLLIGFVFSLAMFIFPKELMTLLYKNSDGYHYIRIFALPFILYYLEAPLISAMTAIDKHKQLMIIDIFASFGRIALLFIFLNNYRIMAVAIADVFSFSLIVICSGLIVIRVLRDKKK